MKRVAEQLEQVDSAVRVPTTPDEPKTLVEVFLYVCKRYQRPNLLNHKRGGSWVPVSSNEMLERIRRIAAGLYAIGVRPGDRVAILSDSRLEWTLTDAGCIFAGGIDVPIYPTLAPPQVRYILNDSGARALVLANQQKFLELKDVLSQCPELRSVILFDPEGVTPDDGMTLTQLEQKGREAQEADPDLNNRLEQQITPEDLATIIYTSGTTGEPKGVMLTHTNLVSNLIDCSGHLEFGPNDTALSVLPLSHVFERQALYMYLYHGMAVYYS